ncbi:HXXEE domain-containing protein [Gorillibacterium sp. sgz5001074]|uniref:HXXEE domain-containing protein n=1 Tax=Gorillibacterium sp. sgz5001074 TaxID=3446695 RepID=UPI003F66CF42
MLEAVNGAISTATLMWLFPVVFMLHDFEEIIFIDGWWERHGSAVLPKLPARLRPRFLRIAQMTSAQFAVAVLLEFICFIPVTYAAVERGWLYLLLAANAVLFLHVFTHVGQWLYLGRYTPGVVTAVLLGIPYPVYFFYRLLQEGLIGWGDIYRSLPAGLLVIPLVLLGHELGRRIAPKRT